MQIVFALIGVASGMSGILLERDSHIPLGGLANALQTMMGGGGLTFLFILLSDLAFNTEYRQGTFLTSLSCGQSRKSWALKKSATFYLFVLLQYAIAFLVFWLFAGIVTEHFGLEGIQMSGTSLAGTKVSKFPGLIVFSIVRTLAFVSLGVFVSTLMPGKLTIGSIVAMGTVLTVPSFVSAVFDNYKRRKIFNFINATICLAVPAKSWIYAVLWLALFILLSVERVKKMEPINRGA